MTKERQQDIRAALSAADASGTGWAFLYLHHVRDLMAEIARLKKAVEDVPGHLASRDRAKWAETFLPDDD